MASYIPGPQWPTDDPIPVPEDEEKEEVVDCMALSIAGPHWPVDWR